MKKTLFITAVLIVISIGCAYAGSSDGINGDIPKYGFTSPLIYSQRQFYEYKNYRDYEREYNMIYMESEKSGVDPLTPSVPLPLNVGFKPHVKGEGAQQGG